MSLSEIFPDAGSMLAYEPEDVAAALLDYAQKRRTRHESQGGVFLVAPLPYASMGAENPRWPRSLKLDVETSLAAALMWLERELLIAKIPDPTAFNHMIHRFTPRGAALATQQDIDAYRQGSLLPISLVHPAIAGRVVPMVQRGDHDVAVFQAFKAVEVAVRAASNLPTELLGVPLMRRAFHTDSGVMADKDLPIAERDAELQLFAGAIGHAKNPGSHRDVAMNRTEAARLILFASYLLTLIDKRVQKHMILAEIALSNETPEPPSSAPFE